MFCIYVYVYNILTNKSDRIPDLNASPEVVIEINNLLYSLHAKSNLFTKLHCNEKHFQTFQLSKYTLFLACFLRDTKFLLMKPS